MQKKKISLKYSSINESYFPRVFKAFFYLNKYLNPEQYSNDASSCIHCPMLTRKVFADIGISNKVTR